MTRQITLALLATLALGACSLLDQDAAYTNTDCRKTMYDDPDVKAAVRSQGQVNTQLGASSVLRDAKDVAYTKCLRENGLLPQGGVERVKRGWL
jgi:hypothetical protein